MITEDYCSYEVAKLLKEKGFLKDVDLRMTQNLSFYDNIGLHHNLNKWYDSLRILHLYYYSQSIFLWVCPLIIELKFMMFNRHI